MNNNDTHIGFIGSGNMAEAIIKGLISSKTVPAQRIIATDRLRTRLLYMTDTYGIEAARSNAVAAKRSGVIFITVKPPDVAEALAAIAPELNGDGAGTASGKLIISIAAGITTASLLDALRHGGLKSKIAIVRAMPNIPVTVGKGMTVLTPGPGAGEEELRLAQELFQAVGNAIVLDDESLLDAVTAISGSGPAYVFFFMESLLKAGIKAGLPEDKARTLVLQTALGAAVMAAESEHGLCELRRMVTSPGGTTEAALKIFSSFDCDKIVEKAVMAATARSKELSGGE